MAGQTNAAPVVIKRKKIIQGGEHHGGAWKVAYADFVTAMMAFFMLMWLLNATTEKQRKGLADYFNPVVPVNRISGGGDDALNGDSLFSENSRAQNGYGASSRQPTESERARGSMGTDSGEEQLRTVEEELTARAGESMTSQQILRHVITRLTDEGVVIEVFDLPDAPLFQGDSDRPTATARDLARILAEVLGATRNALAVEGHVRNYPITLIENPVWPLSVARAGAMRSLLQGEGAGPLPDSRFARITGHADRKPVTADPTAPRNNRIEVILLRAAP